MKRQLLNLDRKVSVDMGKFSYSLTFEKNENLPQFEPKVHVNGPEIDKLYGAERINQGFNRYSTYLRKSLDTDPKILNDKKQRIFDNLSKNDGFRNLIVEKKQYNFNTNYSRPSQEDISLKELKTISNFEIYNGWGGNAKYNIVNNETNKDLEQEQKLSVADLGGNQSGLNKAGSSSNQKEDKIINDSKTKGEVLLSSNTPQKGGISDYLYYKGFGKTDKVSKIETIAENAEQPKVGNKDEVEYSKKRQLLKMSN